jgi:LysR family hydrogen peroxide-inducible transcriptional activator
VARSHDIHLLSFSDSTPSRRIAMAWRRSSAMAAFLQQLAQVFRELPAELFTPTADYAGSTRGTLVVDRAARAG